MHDRAWCGGWVVCIGKNVNAMSWKMLFTIPFFEDCNCCRFCELSVLHENCFIEI